ncbi:MAG: PKD domain-containing protein [Bacteroidia bacterium]
MRKHYLLLTLLLGLLTTVEATHFMGAVVWYECISPCTYRVYHNSYYDCSGGAASIPVLNNPGSAPPPPNTATIDVLGYTNGVPGNCSQPQSIGPWTFVSYLEITPICPLAPGQASWTACDGSQNTILNGVAEAVFYQDYDFCSTNCDYVEIGWESCCRNGAITSLNNPLNHSIHVSTTIDLATTNCNSSPSFNVAPHAYLCNDLPTFVDVSAIDPDGDSLVYSLTNCFTDPNIAVLYNPGYTPIQPLGPAWNLTLDSQLGLLAISPVGSSGSLEVGVVCVIVEEYRNGVKIGEILQDVQITILDCSVFPNQNPKLDTVISVSGVSWAGTAGDTIVVCPGDSLQVDFSFIDLDTGDNVSLGIQADNLSGYVFNSTTGNPATGHLSWAASPGDIGQTYSFFFIAEDDHCPLPGQIGEIFYVRIEELCLAADITPGTCGNFDGAIDLNVWGGVAPYTYQWSNATNTEDQINLAPGPYTVVVTDANGLSATATFLVTAADLLLNVVEYPATCDSSDGAIALHPAGGTGPYTYLWNTGATTDSISGLAPGGYSVLVTDALACVNQWVGIMTPPDSCYIWVSGTLFSDLNGNCVKDPGEPGIANQLIDLTPGPAILTDLNGNYSLQVNPGQLHIQAILGAYMSPSCPGSDSVTINPTTYGSVITGVDFAVDMQSAQDLVLTLTSSAAVPGMNHVIYANVTNVGSVTVNPADLQVQYDPQETYVLTNPLASSVNTATSTVDWQFGPVPPGGQYVFQLVTWVDTAQSVDSTFMITGIVNPVMGDTTPGNNVDTLIGPYQASYDPNDKQVSPAGIGPLGLILPSQNRMKYTVRFQNTGTYQAAYVVIRDTLDHDLDALGFQTIASSHPYTLIVQEDSILVFTFANINLPDSASDPVGSQGFVSYLMPHRGTLEVGTEITNQAAIYFDFNAPIFTNTVRNTIFTYPNVAITQDTLCEGETVFANLTATGMPPYMYEWSTGAQGVSNGPNFSTAASIPGHYTLRITDAFGIQAFDSVKMWVEPLPDASFGFNRVGTQVNFTDASTWVDFYSWNFGDGNTSNLANPQHVYAGSGEYQVQMIAGNKCGADTLYQTVSIFATDLEEEFGRSVKLMPNPFSSQAELQFSNPNGASYQLMIYDVSGKLVQSYPAARNDRFVIERQSLSAGMYLYRLVGEHSHSGKLMVE